MDKNEKILKDKLLIHGMTCVRCVDTVKKSLESLPDVKEVHVNLSTEKAIFLHEEDFDMNQALVAIKNAGYKATIIDKSSKEKMELAKKKEDRRLNRIFLFSIIAALPFFIKMMVMFFDTKGHHLFLPIWLEFALATAVQIIVGSRFYKGAYYALKNKNANMDVLVALGTTVAYLMSVIATLFLGLHALNNFESSVFILTFILFGKWLENKAKKKTNQAIASLLEMQNGSAIVVEKEKQVVKKIENLTMDDKILVKPFEKIPIDAIVLSGNSHIDEAMLTGESKLVHKTVDENVFQGTMNQEGTLVVQATSESHETILSQIIEMVEDSQGTKSNLQKLADKISSVFVPIVLGIALLSFFLTWLMTKDIYRALLHATSVLVISCPCALGLATPIATVISSGVASKRGIFLKNLEALENLTHIDTFVFDKTGTLTEGKQVVTRFSGDTCIFPVVVALEKNSTHPIATAVLSFIQSEETLEVSDFKEIAGYGVIGTIQGVDYFVGGKNFLKEKGLSVPVEKKEQTKVFVFTAIEILGTFDLDDRIKPESSHVVEVLKNEQVDVFLLTGDTKSQAKKIAKELDISLENVFYEVLPTEKNNIVQKLSDEGKKVAMVGDGINDAPALSLANVGISMGTGSDIAIETSDITLLNGEIENILAVRQLAKKTVQKIKQNLFWAFFYNAIGIPLAAIGLFNPVLAALAMSLSSVCVMMNSLLLKRVKI